MKKLFILALIAAVFIGFGIISCQSASTKTVSECPMKKMGHACPGHDNGKPCPVEQGKGSCDECKEAAEKINAGKQGLLVEIQKLNDEAIGYMGAKQFDKALEIFKVLEDKFPPNQVTIYNIACAHSLAGHKKDGVFYARKAVQYGWSDWKKMDEDADLDNIRNEDDYIKLRAAVQLIYPEGVQNPPACQGKCKEKGTSHEHPHEHPHE